MEKLKVYDVAVAGGGLAGLAVTIQLSRQGHSVILFEKEKYPFHKVCGEYISLESWDFLNNLGVDLDQIKVPIITKLDVSAVNGKIIHHNLPLGGFGISRFKLDSLLAEIARNSGAVVMDQTKVNNIEFYEDHFVIDTDQKKFFASVVLGSWGKRSNLDVKWQRKFSLRSKTKLNNFVGIKYHIRGKYEEDTIALHNFKNGYCGLGKIEEGLYNLCYLTTADNLQKNSGDIKKMEKEILMQNPHLKYIFSNASFPDQPLTISQISFDKKSQVENHVLMIGDSAGMITPLCGNGMSMALHASKIASVHVHHFLIGNINREKMEKRYVFQWQKQFKARMRTGRRIQRLFGKSWVTNAFISFIKPFPGLIDSLIRQTHGKPF